jgi:hypothetical protein
MDGYRLARAVETAYLAIWDHHADTPIASDESGA